MFGSDIALARHCFKDHLDMIFYCDICRKQLPSKKYIADHKKMCTVAETKAI